MGSSNTHTDTSPSSSPPQSVAQPTQQTKQRESSARSTPSVEPDQLASRQTSISSPSTIKRNAAPIQQPRPSKRHRKASFASIMTSIRGIPLYSHGTPPVPLISNAPPHRKRNTSKQRPSTSTSTSAEIHLPQLDQLHPPRPPAASSWYPTAAAPPAANNNTHTPLPPFDPANCHWRALRDVAFVIGEKVDLSPRTLCALLRFRYARDDPQMARVRLWHVMRMYEFCATETVEWYERDAVDMILGSIRRDLRAMREGEVGGVSRDL